MKVIILCVVNVTRNVFGVLSKCKRCFQYYNIKTIMINGIYLRERWESSHTLSYVREGSMACPGITVDLIMVAFCVLHSGHQNVT